MSLQDIADCLKLGLSPGASSSLIDSLLNSCKKAAADLSVDYKISSNLNNYQRAVLIRAQIVQRIADISSMSQVALSRGFLIPDSPFPQIELINATRQVFVPLSLSVNDQATMFKAAVDLSKITVDYKKGTITFERNPAWSISSYEVSVDGLAAQTGDPLVDILGYQPDGDYVKRKRALDSLAKLDFTKRKPYLLFTADFGDGTVVCWSKMHDASGYKISRHDVFTNSDLPDVFLDNSSVIASTQELLADDRFFQILSFYDWVDHNDVMAYVDPHPGANSLRAYTLSGLQKKSPGTPFIFDVPTNSLFFSPSIVLKLEAIMKEESAKLGRDPNTLSPYPSLSQAIYGDSGYGWILAGCNVIAAGRRGESEDTIRSLGFIGSTPGTIDSLGRAGKLVVPNNVGDVRAAVERSISSYGVSQTIISALDGVGMTEFISGKDDPKGISDNPQSADAATSGLSRILSAIDPATATLDPKLLASSTQSPSHKLFSKASFSKSISVVGHSVNLEEVLGDKTIDLTTYEGMGQLMDALRIIYDFYPGALG